MELFRVDQDVCDQDGICSKVCPVEIIRFEKGKYPVPVNGAEEICIRCGHCVAACPKGCFAHTDIPLDKCTPVNKDELLSGEQSEHFLRNRRSIRSYKDKKVSNEVLEKLIHIARYAPSGHNSQTAEWMVYTNREDLNKFSKIVSEWMAWMVENLPDVALPLHMDRTLKRYEAGNDVILRNAPSLIIAHAPEVDQMAQTTCTICLSYLELAAMGMGLGTCWAGFLTAAAHYFPKMQEALDLPEGHKIFGAMMVGYPKFRYHRLPPRKDPKIIWR